MANQFPTMPPKPTAEQVLDKLANRMRVLETARDILKEFKDIDPELLADAIRTAATLLTERRPSNE